MREVLLVGLAGAIGTLSRFAVNGVALRTLGERFPFATLIVNVVGSLLLGIVVIAIGVGSDMPRALRVAITVGFFGAFTTYSTFAIETVRFLEGGAWWSAALNVSLNLVLGIAAVWLGLSLGRTFFDMG